MEYRGSLYQLFDRGVGADTGVATCCRDCTRETNKLKKKMKKLADESGVAVNTLTWQLSSAPLEDKKPMCVGQSPVAMWVVSLPLRL